jgi:hypothetical protein
MSSRVARRTPKECGVTRIRKTARRKADALAALEKNGDAWLATAGSNGDPHLIVVAAAWVGERVAIATRAPSRTARNLGGSGVARLGLGSSQDVTMVDVAVERTAPAGADPDLDAAFERAVGWSPGAEGPDWMYFVLRPTRIQSYRGYGELKDRDVMLGGRWLA